jgi:SAM-dependent methyltransferase
MPLTQQDIRQHYEQDWQRRKDRAQKPADLGYSSAAEDAVIYPIYEQLVRDLRIPVDGGAVLDVGAGSGRWVRFFLERFSPARLTGIDVTHSSVALLREWHLSRSDVELCFEQADIGAAGLDLGELFDLINVGNVLFHIPEEPLFVNALHNLARHLRPGGRIVTTEYMPRTTFHTEWMLVRSRYHFEQVAEQAGLRIVDIRATGFFNNDPCGLDGGKAGAIPHFNQVRAMQKSLANANADPQTRAFLHNFIAVTDQACLAFCRERVPDIDLPTQKLVVLAKRG